MKSLLPLLLLAGAIRGGVFAGNDNSTVMTFELDARRGNWSFAPAYEFVHGGHDVRALHIDVRRYLQSFWIGGGATWITSGVPASDRTWNADAGFAFRGSSAWQPFVALRYYRYRMPIFRDEIRGTGSVLSLGISRRFR